MSQNHLIQSGFDRQPSLQFRQLTRFRLRAARLPDDQPPPWTCDSICKTAVDLGLRNNGAGFDAHDLESLASSLCRQHTAMISALIPIELPALSFRSLQDHNRSEKTPTVEVHSLMVKHPIAGSSIYAGLLPLPPQVRADLTIPNSGMLSAEGAKPTAAARGLHAERGFEQRASITSAAALDKHTVDSVADDRL